MPFVIFFGTGKGRRHGKSRSHRLLQQYVSRQEFSDRRQGCECSVLQGVAGCCRVLQGVAGCCRMLQGVAGCCRVLHGVAVCCRVLQCSPGKNSGTGSEAVSVLDVGIDVGV